MAAVLNATARDDFVHRQFPVVYWLKLWHTNLFEPLTDEYKRQTFVEGISPN